MATPPFLPDETKPASSDLISAFPAAEQTFRDIIEDWLLTISTSSGVLKSDALPATIQLTGSVIAGTDAGSMSDIASFAQPLGAVSASDMALTLENTSASGVGAILFNVGTTAQGQIRYLHASEDMTFYTNNTLRATLDVNGLVLNVGNFQTSTGGQFQSSVGDATMPGYSWGADTNTGWWADPGVSNTWALNGTSRIQFDAVGITMLNNDIMLSGEGSNTAPAFSFAADTNTGMYRIDENELGFTTGGSLRLAVNNDNVHAISDRFLVGGSSYTGLDAGDVGASIQGAAAGTPGAYSGTVSGAACIFVNRLASNGNIVEFYRQSSLEGSISITTSATSYNTTSDARRKENPRDFDSGSIIDRLPMYEFDWRDGSGIGYGALVSADVATYFPTAFTYDADNDLWSADYSKLIPVLWEEVASLRVRVAELEA